METDHNNDYWISKYKGLILGEKISELLFRPFLPLLCGSREIAFSEKNPVSLQKKSALKPPQIFLMNIYVCIKYRATHNFTAVHSRQKSVLEYRGFFLWTIIQSIFGLKFKCLSLLIEKYNSIAVFFTLKVVLNDPQPLQNILNNKQLLNR